MSHKGSFDFGCFLRQTDAAAAFASAREHMISTRVTFINMTHDAEVFFTYSKRNELLLLF